MKQKSYNLNSVFEILPWDSDFFKFNVARIKKHADLTNDTPIFKELFNNDVKLAYYSSSNELNLSRNSFYDIFLVDKKTTYSKDVTARKQNNNVVPYRQVIPNEKLVNLAISSGIYSRFNTDKRIGRKNFESLYTQWITKSVSKEIAEDVLVYDENNDILGFVTIGKKGERADIGIIAVDAECRGKGIGKSLMFEAENYFLNETKKIQVVTQGSNLPACKLYESCGYKIEKVEFLYHLWIIKRD